MTQKEKPSESYSILFCIALRSSTFAHITDTVDTDCVIHCVGDRPGWCHRKAHDGGSALHSNRGVAINQMYICQYNQLVFTVEVVFLVKPKNSFR